MPQLSNLHLPNAESEAFEATARRITNDWMAHLGYTAEQIAATEVEPDHSQCDPAWHGWGGWDCIDEEGEHRHPIHCDADETAQLVVFVLEHPTLGGAP